MLQYHHAVLFRAVCYCFLCCRTALPEHTPSHTLTFAHTRTHMLKLTHAHTPLPMLTFIHTHTGPHTRLHPHTCSHPLIHTGSKLHIQPWSHTTTPWPSGFVSVCFVCLFDAALSFHRVKTFMPCAAHSFLLWGNGCVQAEVTAQRILKPGCFVPSPAVWSHCRSPWASISNSEDLPRVKNTVRSMLFGNVL